MEFCELFGDNNLYFLSATPTVEDEFISLIKSTEYKLSCRRIYKIYYD